MATDIAELIARWDSGEGKPFKGSLIDIKAYEAEPGNIGCMCAQGQALHVLGGWEPQRLRDTEQRVADLETAKLLNISVAHSILLRSINDKQDGAPSVVLTEPGKVLGDQWSKLLDFWLHLDRMTPEQWAAGRAAARDAARDAAWAAGRAAARDAAWDAARAAGRAAARDAARDAAGCAASEIQGARILREKGLPFYFLPLFGFDSPEAIPTRPAGYGNGIVPTA